MAIGDDAPGVGRRALLGGLGLSLAAAPALAGPHHRPVPASPSIEEQLLEPEPTSDAIPPEVLPPGAPDWTALRQQWRLTTADIDMSAMLFASHPKPVRDAIARHRDELDLNPVRYLRINNKLLQNRARAGAGRYFGVAADNVALCESTTSGIGLLYNGLRLRAGDEILTTAEDYYVTHDSLRMAASRTGARVRRIDLYESAAQATIPGIVGRIIGAIGPETRVLALTWVHSSTGLKMPIRAIADALAPINARRSPSERVLFCVDGVHGFGVEDETLPGLGCDFLVAGCHKWLFGPRGTGVVFGTPAGWARVTPTVPTFLASNAYSAWIGGHDPGPTTAARMTPGGFKAFEHVWALTEAFQFQLSIGKAHVAARTRELASRLKTGLSAMPHVRLRTPMSPALSAGIVSFDVAGLSADAVVDRLQARRVLASAAPYARRHVRLTPSIRNSPREVDSALAIIRSMGKG